MMLYQDQRPTKFQQVIGNKSTVTSLQKALAKLDHAHVFLFTGPSGCGKTTLARIVGHTLNCGEMNTIEVNAADRRGIDDVRDLLRQTATSPMGGGSRLFIVDEAHMMTKEAQNCLLKALEDVPPYQYYVLCSTDPQKILKTIQNRCDRYEVSTLKEDDLMFLLIRTMEHLEIDISDDVIAGIVDSAEGCPRVALVLLEKVSGLDEKDALELVVSHHGQTKELIELCRAVVSSRWTSVVQCYNGLDDPDPEKIRRCVLGYLASCLLKSDGPKASHFAQMIEQLESPTYDSGKAGILMQLRYATEVK